MSFPDVKLKKSSVAGKVPLVGDLSYGELAINYEDGYLYYKDASNNIDRFLDSDRVVTAARNSISSSGSISYDATTGILSYTGLSVTSSETAPVSPSDTDFWFDRTTGELKIWYVDSDGGQWVVPYAQKGADGATGSAGADGSDGLGWTGGSYDSSTGVVTFTSTDGLGFSTTDIRGASLSFDYDSALPSTAGYSEGDLFLVLQ